MIYISLTTVPKRMNFWDSFSKNLESLLNQKTDKDYKVILNIPYYYKINENEEYILNEELLKLAESNSKLIINRVDNDLGPITKITGVLSVSSNPSDVLIICDDDHYYHEDMIEYHILKRNQYMDSIISFRGDMPIQKREWIEDDIKKYMLRPTHIYFPVKHDSQLVIPGHWHSVGYLRKFFEDDFMTDEILNASNNDDIIIGYYFKKKNRDILCVKWDGERDWRAVNENGRPAWSFPIKYALPMPDSGFNEFRRLNGDGYGKSSDYTLKLIQNHDIVYSQKISKVIVTLTTIPSRILQEYDQGIKSNLYSLINQEYDGEYEIHFNVPKIYKRTGEEYVIPDWIKQMSVDYPKFKIFDNLEDYGSITKLVPTLLRTDNMDAIIIVCDDDLVYHPKMVDEQVRNQKNYENTACGYDGSRPVNPNDFDDVRNNFVVSVYKDVYVKILQHYKTISYKRSFFKQDFFDDFVGDAWNDDIIVSAYMGKSNIKKLVRCYEHEEKLITIEEWRNKGGVTTFPVLKHTSHEGMEGCNLYRRDNIDDKHMKYINLGYI